ncbi:DNA starvation/stationary phase protection protein [Kribbella sp. NPDC006257]|uniref:Dps family protein n=1 Tax=Kribbella sp. NPDC006257 TaxID=3156738 RepID=UPI00339E31A4
MTTSQIRSPLDEVGRSEAGVLLQETLVDLVDLSLLGKQAHWTVVGPRFRTVHLQLDEIVDAARLHADTVAERAAAVGVAPDARAATVAGQTGVPQLAEGWLTDDAVVSHFVDAYAKVIGRMRDRIERAGRIDLVTQDLLIQITADLEKQSWMLQAEQAAAGTGN